MFVDLLSLTIGEQRARDLLGALEVHDDLDQGFSDQVPPAAIAGALHFLLFEALLKRAPTALQVAGDSLRTGQRLTIDHAAMATIDSRYTGALARGRHHLGAVLEPLGFVQTQSHDLQAQGATAHIYRFLENTDAVPDFVVMELHVDRHSTDFQTAAHNVFGQSPTPNVVRVQTLVRKLQDGHRLNLQEAADFLQGVFSWFGRQHVPPPKSDYETLADENSMAAWMAHEGQGLSHVSVRVPHLTAIMDMQIREERPLLPIKTSADQMTKLVSMTPDQGMRPFRDATGRILQESVPIANIAFIERGASAKGPRFDPSLF